jgi:hypothetical protein
MQHAGTLSRGIPRCGTRFVAGSLVAARVPLRLDRRQMEILLLVLVFVMLLARNGFVFVLPLGFVWLVAGTFDPPITSNVVWAIGCIAGYMFDADLENL